MGRLAGILLTLAVALSLAPSPVAAKSGTTSPGAAVTPAVTPVAEAGSRKLPDLLNTASSHLVPPRRPPPGLAAAAAAASDDEAPGVQLPPSPVLDRVDPAGDPVDVFSVHLDARQLLVLSASSPGAVVLAVYNSDVLHEGVWSLRTAMSTVASVTGTTTGLAFPAATSDTYFVAVFSDTALAPSQPSPYTLTWQRQAASVDDLPPGSPLGVPLAGTLGPGNSLDVYGADLAAGTRVRVHLDGTPTVAATLYAPSSTPGPLGLGAARAVSLNFSGGPPDLVYVAPTPGHYLLVITGTGSYGGSVGLDRAEPDDSFATAPDFVSTSHGTLATTLNWVDVVRVPVAAGREVRARVTGASAAVVLQVFTGSPLDPYRDPPAVSMSSASPQVSWAPPDGEAGTLLVAVFIQTQSTGYDLSIELAQASLTGADREPGIPLPGSGTTRNLDPTVDTVHVFRVTVADQSRFTFSLDDPRFVAYLRAPGTPRGTFFAQTVGATPVPGVYTPPSNGGGLFYLYVQALTPSPANYTLTWSLTPDPSGNVSGPELPPSPVQGSLSAPLQVVAYRIALKRGDSLDAFISGQAGRVALYGPVDDLYRSIPVANFNTLLHYVVPDDAGGTYHLVVFHEAAGSSPPPTGSFRLEWARTPAGSRWLFAEGSTRAGIQTYLTLENADGAADSKVRITYLLDGGAARVSPTISVPHAARTTVDVNADIGPERDVSIVVDVLSGPEVAVERPVYVNRSVDAAGAITGGHVGGGVHRASFRRLFAEGSTRPGIQTYLTVQNPDPVLASRVRVTWSPGPGIAPVAVEHVIPPSSRSTVNASEAGSDRDVAALAEVLEGPAVVWERPVYFSRAIAAAGHVDGGHLGGGVERATAVTHLAEGSTRGGIQEYLTFLGPGPGPSRALAQFSTGVAVTVTVEAGQRATLDVNQAVGDDEDVAVMVRALSGPAPPVERVEYFSRSIGAAGEVDGGHASSGVPAPSRFWLFAEGSTRPGLQTYLTVLNPSPEATVQAVVTYLIADGPPVARALTVAPLARVTVDVNEPVEGLGPDLDTAVAVTVSTGPPLVIERPVYFRRDIGAAGEVDGGHVGSGFPA